MDKDLQYYAELVEEIGKGSLSKDKIAKLKIKLCQKYKKKKIPTDIEVILNTPRSKLNKIKKFIQSKPTRTISGVAVVAVMSKPHKCPHGKCSICPGGVDSIFGDVPQSYTGHEPATMRGVRGGFNSYIQVFNRLEQYIVQGHVPDKVELIVMGGTFISVSKKYQKEFITSCFQAMNDFSSMFFRGGELKLEKFKEFFELPGDVGSSDRLKKIHFKINKLQLARTVELKTEQKRNEKTKIRCVGLTIETRPDYGTLEYGNQMLELGATRVEIGIQSVYDDVLEKMNRGHSVSDSIKSIQELRDLGFKLNFHYMIGLPGSSSIKDLNGFKQLFDSEDFKPDMIKIYPCMVMPGTKLENLMKQKKFKPINTDQAIELIGEFKRYIPEYCRVMRVQRDIPPNRSVGGVDKSNLRQYVHEYCANKKIKCKCIRCREVGRAKQIDKLQLVVREYVANGGKEYFISIEDVTHDVISGFCRLRIPQKSMRKEITLDSALIRELHVYGSAVAVGDSTKKESQHKGLGKKLMNKAEEIALKEGRHKLVVISGIGVREYYRKIGYKKEGPYMVKKIVI
ncbi:tRNA uridine(34) 5-carboxymethylaminomethyl modification radical SAM/GNAT enzyme Elp3 [Candidatus Woesearchaeota archaeon]|nr:tRNA uridine(34) 5-carboxymethylaminomethyl modification radical SAM/GNAT enzyme Elp3 [Candidatus Woesearchaeota archaeon]